MAKLKAPLLSMGASGAIGKTIVYFPWKGINAAREYVVPANPKTQAQLDQRAFVTSGVAAVHAAEAAAVSPLVAIDKTAYALYGSTFPTPRTWFNQVIQRWLLASVNAEHPQVIADATFSDPDPGEITLVLFNHQYETEAGFMYCGTSKTNLSKKVAADGVASSHMGVFTGLTSGVKYFFQFRPTKVTDDKFVARSGIYYHLCT